MVQVLPYAPSPLERIGAQITQGFGDIAGNIEQKRARTALEKILNPEQQQQPDMQGSPQNMANAPEPSPQQTAAKNALQNVDLMNLVGKAYKDPKAEKAFVDSLISQQTIQGKRENEIAKEQRAKESSKESKIREEVELSRSDFLQRRKDLSIAKDQILQNPGDIGGIRNSVAKILHLDPLVTQSAATFRSAIKNRYILDIKKLGGRLNQFIESQIEQATARVGLSDESNLSILEIAESGMELEDRINQIKEDLLEQGVPASKIESMAYKQAKDFAEQNYSKLAYKLKVLNEKEKGPDSLGQLKEVPEGTPLTYENAQAFLQQADGDEERALRVAKKLGYTIPGEDLYK